MKAIAQEFTTNFGKSLTIYLQDGGKCYYNANEITKEEGNAHFLKMKAKYNAKATILTPENVKSYADDWFNINYDRFAEYIDDWRQYQSAKRRNAEVDKFYNLLLSL